MSGHLRGARRNRTKGKQLNRKERAHDMKKKNKEKGDKQTLFNYLVQRANNT